MIDLLFQITLSKYGDSLLKAVEILAFPAPRLPAMASKINSGGLIERRITMIMSNPSRANLRWLQAFVLAGALVVIPMGLTFSQNRTQDRDAVIASSRAAVAAGEITPEQGNAKRAAISQRAESVAVAKRIRAAVQSGEITEEQAKGELEAYRQSQEQKAKLEAEFAAAVEQFRAAVAAGEITPEQAKAKLDAYKKSLEPKAQGRDPVADFKAHAFKLQAAVADGSLTREQADAKLADAEKILIGRVVHDFTTAVEAGKLTKEEAAAKMTAFLKALEAVKAKR